MPKKQNEVHKTILNINSISHFKCIILHFIGNQFFLVYVHQLFEKLIFLIEKIIIDKHYSKHPLKYILFCIFTEKILRAK